MKSFYSVTLWLVAIVIAGTFFTSCKKDDDDKDEQTVEVHKTTTTDNSKAEVASNDLLQQVNQAIWENIGEFQKTSGTSSVCANVTINNNGGNYPKSLKLDFGTGCTVNNITRKGVVDATITGPYRDAGSVLTITTSNYEVNGFKVSGTKIITNEGLNANDNPHFSVVVQNAVITSPGGDQLTWSTSRVNEWVEGDSTYIIICDDVYHVTGTASGTNSAGRSFTIDITSPLVKNVCCPYVQSGTLEVKPQGISSAVVDYGSGSCDGQFTVEWNGNTYSYTIQ